MTKACLACLALLGLHAHSVRAQDHLTPDVDAFAKPDRYLLKVRHVFAQAFERDVILRSLVVPSFQSEHLVGVRLEDEQGEAFVLDPSSRIGNTELIELYREGKTGQFGADGKLVPLEEDEEFKKLKRDTPADYREIKAIRHARPIPRELAEGIKSAWEKMLLDVRHAKDLHQGNDGETYHFSAWVLGRGEISGQVWSPEAGSKTERLTSLANALGDYARGKAELGALKAALEQARKSIDP